MWCGAVVEGAVDDRWERRRLRGMGVSVLRCAGTVWVKDRLGNMVDDILRDGGVLVGG